MIADMSYALKKDESVSLSLLANADPSLIGLQTDQFQIIEMDYQDFRKLVQENRTPDEAAVLDFLTKAYSALDNQPDKREAEEKKACIVLESVNCPRGT